MSIKQRDREFRLEQITYVDYKTIEMERVLVNLFPRLKFGAPGSRRKARKSDYDLNTFLGEFKKHDAKIVRAAQSVWSDEGRLAEYERTKTLDPAWFDEVFSDDELALVSELIADFKANRADSSRASEWFQGLFAAEGGDQVLLKWLETDLMDVVNRGKPNQAVASPRPLHGNIYRFRNAKHSRDFNVSDQIYWMLYYARRGRSQSARDALKSFFFPGIDMVTDTYDPQVVVDVETQALLHLDQQIKKKDIEDEEKNVPPRYPPLCVGQADLLADDVLRLLAYKDHMPRSVLVDHLKTLFALHLALFHLRLLKLVPALVKRQSADPICATTACPLDPHNFATPYGECPYQIGLVVDMGDPANPHMSELARRSADIHYRRIPAYVQAHLTVKKLHEMAEYLRKINRLPLPATGYFGIGDILSLLQPKYSQEREAFFKSRLVTMVEDATGGESELDPELKRITEMGLTDFETFIEILVTNRGQFYRSYITESLDSFLLKNTESGLLRQFHARGSPRFFSLGSRLLELLLQLAVLRPANNGGYETRTDMRVDELLHFFRERYGLYVDRLPVHEGLGQPSILDQRALRQNINTFKIRLREIGFFQDLSDAYFTQIITPRFVIQSTAVDAHLRGPA
jgi:hypothetical protein